MATTNSQTLLDLFLTYPWIFALGVITGLAMASRFIIIRREDYNKQNGTQKKE